MVDEPGIRCRTGFGDRRNDMRCHKQSPAHKVVEVYPLAAAWSTRFLQPVSAAVRDTRRLWIGISKGLFALPPRERAPGLIAPATPGHSTERRCAVWTCRAGW